MNAWLTQQTKRTTVPAVTVPAVTKLGVMTLVLLALSTASGQNVKFPPALTNFASPGKEVFVAGGPGKWDTKIRERGWILRDGNHYHMWYTGYDGTRAGTKKLGYASSDDGIRWTKSPRNPIYGQHWVEDMMVVKHQGIFWMFAEGKNDQAHLLASSDAVNWKRIGRLDVRQKKRTTDQARTVWYSDGLV